MKIKKLILENINSLYGHWEIDFESPAFSDGLFAIIGPTGSGKTTILDAISLALFAATPRISGGSTKLIDTVSRGASGSLAELTFEINGEVYQSSFGFSAFVRGPNKGKINPNTATHILKKGEKILSEKNSETQAEIAKLIGMKAEQFYRAVLLAQGKFDAFLSAGKDKADILEQITGTEIYSQIGKKVNQKNKELHDQINEIDITLNAQKTLSPEETAQKQTEIDSLTEENEVLQKKQTQLDDQLKLFEAITANQKKLSETILKLEELLDEQKNFQPDEARLAAGQKAARIQPYFQKYFTTEQQLHKDIAEEKSNEEKLKILTCECKQKEAEKVQTETEQKKQQDENKLLEELLKKVIPLDDTIKDSEKDITQLSEQEKDEQENLAANNDTCGKLKSTLQEIERAHDGCSRFLEEHKTDASLQERWPVWQEKLKHIQQKSSDIKKQQEELAKLCRGNEIAHTKIAEQKKICDEQKNNTEKAEADLKQKEDDMKNLLNGRRKEDIENDKARLLELIECKKKIIALEDERKKLKDGSPCPLCGSIDHPYAIGNTPCTSQNEKDLQEVETLLKNCDQSEKAIQQAQAYCKEANHQLEMLQNNLQNDIRNAEEKNKQYLELKEKQKECEENLNKLENALKAEYRQYGIECKDDAVPDLTARINTYNTNKEKLGNLQNEKIAAETNLKNIEENIAVSRQKISEYTNQLNEKKQELAQLREQRQELFGDRKVEAERSTAQKKLNKAQENASRAAIAASTAAATLNASQERQADLQQKISTQTAQLEVQRQEFLNACDKEKMSVEKFKESQLSGDELSSLISRKTQLENDIKSHSETKLNLERTLAEQCPKLQSGISQEQLQLEKSTITAQLEEKNQRLGALKSELSKNEELAKNQHDLRDQLEQLQQKQRIWDTLNSMIGGAEAQGFRRYAQGITLDHLLTGANQLLKQMNGRYELLQDPGENLDIDVIDHWQGDDIRSSKNLSGGERFQISLALALALSNIAGEKIRIDSLFLDEGFGTLDSNSLELALQTLTSLHQSENKTIGIISHVQAIAENLPAQITVTPVGNGRSKLSGAGIRD